MGVGTDYFAVCCADSIDEQTLNNFLETAHGTGKTVDCEPRLVVITNLSNAAINAASTTPLPLFESPFEGRSPTDIAKLVQRLARSPDSSLSSELFVILDKNLAKERIATMVQIENSNPTQLKTLKGTFEVINYILLGINVGVTSLSEKAAQASEHGVLEHRDDPGRMHGGPAPRKRLGG